MEITAENKKLFETFEESVCYDAHGLLSRRIKKSEPAKQMMAMGLAILPQIADYLDQCLRRLESEPPNAWAYRWQHWELDLAWGILIAQIGSKCNLESSHLRLTPINTWIAWARENAPK